MPSPVSLLRGAVTFCLLATAMVAKSQTGPEGPPVKIDWTKGPSRVDVGAVGELALPEGMLFAGPADTKKIMERLGNPSSGKEAGLVVPASDTEQWMLVYEYRRIGYIKDAAREKIDAEAILANIREATEQANKERQKLGAPAIHVTGWQEAPHYDARTNNLVWAILGRDDQGEEFANYNVRVLGREGVMSVTLVEAPQRLAASKPALDRLLSAYTFKRGKTYAEWVPGDKVAEYGLTALVAAGAGAAAAKLGFFALLGKFLAKAWQLLIVAVLAIGAALRRAWNAARGRTEAREAPRPVEPGT